MKEKPRETVITRLSPAEAYLVKVIRANESLEKLLPNTAMHLARTLQSDMNSSHGNWLRENGFFGNAGTPTAPPALPKPIHTAQLKKNRK